MPQRVPTKPAPRRRPPEARPSAARRGYGRGWQARRSQVLAERPLCEDCLARGLTAGATDVDHVTAKAAGGDDGDDNLRSLCHSCHSRKTVAADGGFGRAAARVNPSPSSESL